MGGCSIKKEPQIRFESILNIFRMESGLTYLPVKSISWIHYEGSAILYSLVSPYGMIPSELQLIGYHEVSIIYTCISNH